MSNFSQSQLGAPVIVVTAFVRVDLPGFTLRVWTGIGDLTTLGQNFTGIGDVGSIGAIEEGMDGVAPRVKLALAGIDPVLLNEVEEFVAQGSPVFIWYALADREAGTLLATPDLAFTGYVDQPKIILNKTMTVELACMGALEWAKRQTPGRRNPAYHEAAHPGDLFFKYVDDNDLNFPWGDKDGANPRGAGNRGGNGGSGGDGSGNGDFRPGFGRF